MTEYKRTIDDELDWSLLNQLHSVVLQMSTFCFRTKQVCLTVLVAIVGLIATFTSEKLDTSVFVAGALIPICFWFLDSIAYYYQVKLRGLMDSIRDQIYKRHGESVLRGPNLEVIADTRIDKSATKRLQDAFFNHSMWLYLVLFLINCVLWGAYLVGSIK